MLRCQYFDHSFAFQNWCHRLRKQPLKHDSLVTGKLLLLFLAVVEALSATSKLDIFDHFDEIWSTIPPILPLVAIERGHFGGGGGGGGGGKPKIGVLQSNTSWDPSPPLSLSLSGRMLIPMVYYLCQFYTKLYCIKVFKFNSVANYLILILLFEKPKSS